MILFNYTKRIVALFIFFGLMTTMSQAQELSIEAKLANADVARGEKVWRKCRACHTIDEDGPNKVGPNLYGIVNRTVATVESYNYSKAMNDYAGTWTLARLDAYLTKPKAEVPKTKMAFVGLRKEADRLNLLAFLNQSSSSPIKFQGDRTAVASEQTDASSDAAEVGILFSALGAEETFAACTACHSERIVAQQGLTRDQWDELLEWMVDEQGMSELEVSERNLILDYLAEHYNTDRPHFPRAN